MLPFLISIYLLAVQYSLTESNAVLSASLNLYFISSRCLLFLFTLRFKIDFENAESYFLKTPWANLQKTHCIVLVNNCSRINLLTLFLSLIVRFLGVKPRMLHLSHRVLFALDFARCWIAVAEECDRPKLSPIVSLALNYRV